MRLASVASVALVASVASVAPVALAQSLPAGRAEQLGMDRARLARIDSVMQRFVDSGRVAGVVTLVARRGQVVHSGAWGWADREAGRRMETGTLFRIASQTKAITSVAVMMLVEQGKLRLGDPVSRWLPSFAQATVQTAAARVPTRRAITIRDLLTHTAGISYGTDSIVAEAYRTAGLGPAAGWGWYTADKDEPICVTMDRLGTLPFVAQPGERFVYGYNTDILGCVVERVSGRSLDTYLRERIFEPLRMTDTWFFVPEGQQARLAAVYAFGGGALSRAPDDARGQGHYTSGPRVSFAGGAGLVSTAADYARFLQMMVNGGTLDGARLLSPRTVALMLADHVDTLYGAAGRVGGLGFGLGFEVLEDPGRAGQYGAPGRFGWGGAYATTYWADPAEGIVAVIMTQTLPSGGLDLADRFRALVYQSIVAPPGR